MDEQEQLQAILNLAGQAFPAIAAGTQTFSHAGALKEQAIDNACRDSVAVARKILAYAQQPASSQLAALSPFVQLQNGNGPNSRPATPPIMPMPQSRGL